MVFVNICSGFRKHLQWFLLTFAVVFVNICSGFCKQLQWFLQAFAVVFANNCSGLFRTVDLLSRDTVAYVEQ